MRIQQETVVGPLLFIINLNSLLQLEINSTKITYANTTGAIFQVDCWKQIEQKAVKEISKMNNQLRSFRLTLN